MSFIPVNHQARTINQFILPDSQTRSVSFATSRPQTVECAPQPGEVMFLSRTKISLPQPEVAMVEGTISYGMIHPHRNRLTLKPAVWVSTLPPPDDLDEWDLTFPEITLKHDVALPLQYVEGLTDQGSEVHVAVALMVTDVRRPKRPVTLVPPPIVFGRITY